MKIFISYPRKMLDEVETLTSKLLVKKYRPFVDIESITPSDSWEESIKSAIKESDLYIIIFNKEHLSNESFFNIEQRWIKNEKIEHPEKNIITVIFPPSTIKDITPLFREYQIINVENENNNVVWVSKVCDKVDFIKKERDQIEEDNNRAISIQKQKQKITNFFMKNLSKLLFLVITVASLSFLIKYFFSAYSDVMEIRHADDKYNNAQKVKEKLSEICIDIAKKNSFDLINPYYLYENNENDEIKNKSIIIESYEGSWNNLKCDIENLVLNGTETTKHKIYLYEKGNNILAATSYNSHAGSIDFNSKYVIETGNYLFSRSFVKPSEYLDFSCTEEYTKSQQQSGYPSCDEIEKIYGKSFDAAHVGTVEEGSCFSSVEKKDSRYYIFHTCRIDDPKNKPYFRIMRSGKNLF